MVQKTKEYREQIAEQFVRVLEEKGPDWKKEWQSTNMNRPMNAKSGYRYKGINLFHLAFTAIERGYQDPRWATFKQIEEQGWRLHNAKGQGVKVEYWFMWDNEEKRTVTWEEYRKREPDEKRYLPRAKYATVFNADLIEGIPPMPEPELHDINPDELIERISKNMGVEILNDGGNRAFYNLREDRIHLPEPQYFFTDYAYNSTALHELAHASGAAHRLNREMGHGFGTEAYAFEELVAEISSCFVSGNLQMEQDQTHIDNHKAYVQSWIKAVREQPETLVKAIQQAEKAADYLEYKAELIPEREYVKLEKGSVEIKEKNGESKEGNKLMEFQGKVGNIEAYTEQNAKGDITVQLINGTDVVMSETYFTNDAEKAVEDLFMKLDTYTEEWLRLNYLSRGLEKLSENLYRLNGDYFKRIDDTKYFKHFDHRPMMAQEMDADKGNPTAEAKADDAVHKSEEEIRDMLKDVQKKTDDIREDTTFFEGFIRENNLQPEKDQKISEYYVIQDMKTGQTVQSPEGKELQMASPDAARELAESLNRMEEKAEKRTKESGLEERKAETTAMLGHGPLRDGSIARAWKDKGNVNNAPVPRL